MHITAAQIMIEDGAYFKGSIEIERSVETTSGKDASPPAILH
jgi:cytoskeletal protein CcmA (bactofilin family)